MFLFLFVICLITSWCRAIKWFWVNANTSLQSVSVYCQIVVLCSWIYPFIYLLISWEEVTGWLNKQLYWAARNGDKEKAKMYFKRTDIIPYHFRITRLILMFRGYWWKEDSTRLLNLKILQYTYTRLCKIWRISTKCCLPEQLLNLNLDIL